MASRPLEMPSGRIAARPPMRQNVALRWVNAVVPASAASKTSPSPIKRWPPPSNVEAPPHAPVIATSMPAPAVEKKKPVSAGFQSARAVFEAKRTTTNPPPTRRRLPFPAPPAPAVVKQHSVASDLSSSSCSTVDSESSRILEETMEAQHEFMTRSPVRPGEAKKVEKKSLTITSSVTAAGPVPRSPLPIKQAASSHIPALLMTTSAQAKQGQPSINATIDPFQLLLPVGAVPTLPDEVSCVYDNAAIEMQKGVKKVVRKLLKKNKARQEEFKVNSRLFGTDFMDSQAYLDTLIKDFGAIRALQLVPCLLSIQPDILKSKALLLTAKNYLLRNEESLECELRALTAPSTRDSAKTDGVSVVGSVAIPLPDAEVKTLSPIIRTALKVPAHALAAGPQSREEVNSTATVCTSMSDHVDTVDTAAGKNDSAVLPISASKDIVSATILALKKPEFTSPPGGVSPATTIQLAEPMPEPQEAALIGPPPHVTNIVVNAPTPATTTAVRGIDANPVIKKSSESDTPSDSGDEFRAENLFGEPINPTSPQQQQEVAAISPVSSTHSFDEAESLFGERLSCSSRSSTSRRKTVTWGEAKTMEVPVQRASCINKKPAPLIFGLATAGAFDSDSDDSDVA
ncbi:uncharacterized protein KRP23_6247 [Phytophthora ramorum]|uniref:uncharacterized protein n=1 Tax=Phytophthora ramorum TaxID=164328 RepID=UPI0030AF37B1|nr:hypothetical protein KRP23_6247 [Phytophthora ramorum]